MAETTIFSDLDNLISSASFRPGKKTAADVLTELGTPTASIGILDNGQISSHCFSTRQDNTETLFQACSISKPTTGVCVAKLVELGKLNFDDKICDLLPNKALEILGNPRTRPLLEMVTVRHLMSHTAGFSQGPIGFPGYPHKDNLPSPDDVLAGRFPVNTQALRFRSLPGLAFSYSGEGILILQLVIELVMDMPFADVMDKYLLKPLGMTRSFFALPTDEKNISRAHYHGYTPCESEWHTLPELAVAGLWTTPTDLLKLVNAIQISLSGGPGKPYLEMNIAVEMLTKIKEHMALTWQVGTEVFLHSGNNAPGWYCFLLGFADLPWNSADTTATNNQVKDLPLHSGMCVMTNSAVGELAIGKLLHAIAYLKGWTEVPVSALFKKVDVPFKAVGVPLDARWERWEGQWTGGWQIRESDDGHPTAGIHDQAMLALKPAAVPARRYSEGQSIDLVLDGVEIMLRLGWDDQERTVEVWDHLQGLKGGSILHKVT